MVAGVIIAALARRSNAKEGSGKTPATIGDPERPRVLNSFQDRGEPKGNWPRAVVRGDKFSLSLSKVLNKETFFWVPVLKVVIDMFNIEIHAKYLQHVRLIDRIEIELAPDFS